VRSELPGTPVIVLSAGGPGEAGAALLSGMGAAGFFAKPVKVDELLARIHDLVD
jgi:DNA-binding response OmpR family regulator